MEKELDQLKKAVDSVNRVLSADEKNGTIFKVIDVLKGITLPNGDTVDNLVFSTQDLDQFGRFDANRLVKEESAIIEELAQSMLRMGNLIPIDVSKERKVVDGQRRLTAKKIHQVPHPLRYFFHPDADILEVSEANRYNSKWNHRDWLHMHTTLGKEDYLTYETLAQKYEPYMKSRSLRSILMNGRVEAFRREVWESGEFKINKQKYSKNINFLEFLAKTYMIGEGINIFSKNRDFQKALYDLYMKTPNVDEERFLSKIQHGFARLNVKTDDKGYKQQLTRLYNSKISEDLTKMLATATVEEGVS